MRRLTFSPAARRDLEQIAAHVAEAAGRPMAAELVRRIRARCLMLAETPGEIGTARPEIVEGIRSFPTSPYVLFFRYREGEVQIVRILHERQDVGRHLA